MYLRHHLEEMSPRVRNYSWAMMKSPSHHSSADNMSQNTNDKSGHIPTYLFNKPYVVIKWPALPEQCQTFILGMIPDTTRKKEDNEREKEQGGLTDAQTIDRTRH